MQRDLDLCPATGSVRDSTDPVCWTIEAIVTAAQHPLPRPIRPPASSPCSTRRTRPLAKSATRSIAPAPFLLVRRDLARLDHLACRCAGYAHRPATSNFFIAASDAVVGRGRAQPPMAGAGQVYIGGIRNQRRKQ